MNALTGDASWGGYTTVSGRWIVEPGEAVVPTPFLAATGTRVGDTVTLSGLAEPVTVWIVGEVLDTRNDGMQVFTDASTLTDAHPDLTEASHHIAVASGTEVTGYVDALNRDLAPLGVTARMVLTSVAVTGLVAGTVGVPLGVALHGGSSPRWVTAWGSACRTPASPSTTRPTCFRSSSAACSSPPWARSCPRAGLPEPAPRRPRAPNRGEPNLLRNPFLCRRV